MEPVGVLLMIAGLVLLIIAFVVDEGEFALISAMLGIMVLLSITPDKIDDNIVTIQEIEYSMNKCSPFGGLKEIHDGVIICMDETEIKMSFEPEKKVEAE